MLQIWHFTSKDVTLVGKSLRVSLEDLVLEEPSSMVRRGLGDSVGAGAGGGVQWGGVARAR